MTQTQREDIEHLEELAATYRSRLRVLDRQIAAYGVAVPAYIVLDKDQAEQDLAQALAGLRRLRPTQPGERPPYLGLSTFHERDADLFFGREQLVTDLVARAERSSFLIVLGASGSGKSSVVRAGLLPELKGGALPGSERWHYATMRPDAHPLDSLATVLTKLQGGNLSSAVALSRQLADSDRALLLAANMLLDEQGDARLVLVVDQAEELWALAPTNSQKRGEFIEKEQRPFIRLLLTTAEESTRLTGRMPVLVVLTMRADFLHRAAENAELARWIGEHDVIVSPMTQSALREAIVRPAESAGCNFEPGLVDELIEQVQGRSGALPLLEYTLLELWKQRTPDGTLTWKAFKDLGGIEGALAARADAILAARYPASEQRDQLRQVLLRLVQPGEGAADTRRRMRLEDLIPAGQTEDGLRAVIQPLADERLLTTGRDAASGGETVEIAHEALIHAWPMFAGWIDAARTDLRLQLQLEAAAKEWAANGEQPEFLWSGLRLVNAEAWQTRTKPPLNERERRFLAMSQATQRQARNLRRGTLAALAALVVAILAIVTGGSLYFARQQQQSAQQQESLANDRNFALKTAEAALGQALTAEARERDQRSLAQTAEADTHIQLNVSDAQRLAFAAASEQRIAPSTALLLAIEAVARDPNRITSQVLRDVLAVPAADAGSSIAQRAGIADVVYSPDGLHIVTASKDGTVTIWDSMSRHALGTLRGQQRGLTSVTYSPDGSRIVTASNDGTAIIWDSTNRQVLDTLQGNHGELISVAYSSDGSRIAAISAGTLIIWDSATHQVAHTISEPSNFSFTSVAFSPDSKRIITASSNTAILWDATTGESLVVQHYSTGPTYDAAFSPDGQHYVVASFNQTAYIEKTDGEQRQSLCCHADDVLSASYSPDGRLIVTASADGTVQLWDTSDNQSLVSLTGDGSAMLAAAFSPDGSHLVTGSAKGTVTIWEARSGEVFAELASGGNSGPDLSSAYRAALSPDGSRIAVVRHGEVAIQDTKSGYVITILRGSSPIGYIQDLTFSRDGTRVALVSAVAAAVSTEGSDSVTIWDSATGELLVTLSDAAWGGGNSIRRIYFHPNGKQIVVVAYNAVTIWDVGKGNQIRSFKGHSDAVFDASFSPDGTRIVTSSYDKTAIIWDATSGRAVMTLRGHSEPVDAVAYSPDGTRIATASRDQTAIIWDAVSGQALTTLRGHSNWIWGIAFSSSGKELVTASKDRAAIVWDVTTGQMVATLRGHSDDVLGAFFSLDESYVITITFNDVVRLHPLKTQDLLALAACRASRGLNEEEIRRFNVSLPLAFNFAQRTCPPRLSWLQ